MILKGSLKTYLGLGATSSYVLEPGLQLWLPEMLWQYALHQMKLFKDVGPKKSNLLCRSPYAPTSVAMSTSSSKFGSTWITWIFYSPLATCQPSRRKCMLAYVHKSRQINICIIILFVLYIVIFVLNMNALFLWITWFVIYVT